MHVGQYPDLVQLSSFLAVAENLHFGRAADQLHIAQPHLSRIIKRLERELDTVLFERTPRGAVLTQSGQALVQPARAVLDSLKGVGLAVRAADAGDVGLVRVSLAGTSTYELVAELTRTVLAATPGIELRFSSQNFGDPAMSKLRDGQTDIAIGWWDLIPADVSAHVAREDSLMVAVAANHPLANEKSVTFDQLLADPFVSLPPYTGAVLVDRLSRLARTHGAMPKIVQYVPDTQVALAMVGVNVGCHLTLASVARTSPPPNVKFLAVEEAAVMPDVHLRVAWMHEEKSPAVSRVLRMMLSMLEANGSPPWNGVI